MTFVREQAKDLAYGQRPGDLPRLRLIGPWFVMRNGPGEQTPIKTKGYDLRPPQTKMRYAHEPADQAGVS